MTIQSRIITSFTIIFVMAILSLVSQEVMLTKGKALNDGLDHINRELVALLALENAVNRENKEIDDAFSSEALNPVSIPLLSDHLSAAFNEIWTVNQTYHVPELFEGFEAADREEIGLEQLLKEKQDQMRQGQEHLLSLLSRGNLSEAMDFKKNFFTNQLGHEFVEIIDNWILQEKKELLESKTENDHYVKFHMATMNAIWLLFIVVLLWLSYSLNRTIGRRLDRLVQHTRMLAKGDFRKKVDITGSDELARLAISFNEMTAKLATTQNKLLEQSYLSGMSEVAADILHNVKNTFSGISSGCDKINSLIQNSRTGNIRKAVKELKNDDYNRDYTREELLEYIDLATESMEVQLEKIKLANSQIETTSFIINSILTDQYRYTKVDHPLQWCSLHDVLTDTLPLLNHRYTDKAEIKIDSAINEIGEIHIHRIVFIQVITNILTNAIESIVRHKQPDGLISITASLDNAPDGEMIHLQFKDNGEGIKIEQFESLFKRGRSSKNDTGHMGLGLHWAANALYAMNGRMYAESSGEGKGATFHLLIKRKSGNSSNV